jgi:hypothetical protein
VTLLVSPVTCQRKVDDWPIRMEVGSAENCATTGAAAAGAGATGVEPPPFGAGAAIGGGGAMGALLLLQPAANTVSEIARQMAGILCLSNMNIAS